jgi:hypothetical protein
MKKISLIFALIAGSFVFASAQTTTNSANGTNGNQPVKSCCSKAAKANCQPTETKNCHTTSTETKSSGTSTRNHRGKVVVRAQGVEERAPQEKSKVD